MKSKKTHTEKPDLQTAIDPRLMYVMVMPPDAGVRRSLFQDFSEPMLSMRWAFERLVLLPATIYEPLAALPDLLAMRVAGLASWRLRQFPAPLLNTIMIDEQMPLWILFTVDDESAKTAIAFTRRQRFAPLHFSLTGQPGTVPFEEMTIERLRAHFLSVIDTAPTPGLVQARPSIAA